jgi:hypothetical protein
MPTRSYFFPKDFKHLEEILLGEPEGCEKAQLEHFRALGLPPIPTDGTLALFLGISPSTIFAIRRIRVNITGPLNFKKKMAQLGKYTLPEHI